MVEPIEHYFRGFGGRQTPYFCVSKAGRKGQMGARGARKRGPPRPTAPPRWLGPRHRSATGGGPSRWRRPRAARSVSSRSACSGSGSRPPTIATRRSCTASPGSTPDRLYEQIRVIALIVDPVPYALHGRWRASPSRSRGVASGGRWPPASCCWARARRRTSSSTCSPQPRYAAWLYGEQVDVASWPSGHGTAAMTIALCAVLVAPPAYRAAVGFVGFCMTRRARVRDARADLALPVRRDGGLPHRRAVGLARHRVAARRRGRRPGSPRPCRRSAWLIAAGTGCVLVATAAVWVASDRVPLDTADRALAAVGALVIASLALALVVATLVTASESSAAERRRRVGQPERWVSPASGARSS